MKEFWVANRTIYPAIFRVLIGLLLLTDLIFTLPSGYFLFDSTYNNFIPNSGIIGVLSENWKIFSGVYGLILLLFILGIGRNLISFLVFLCYWFWVEMTMPLLTWGDTILKFSLLYFVLVNSFQYLSIQKSNYLGIISKLGIWSILLHLFLIYLNNAYFKLLDADWQEGRALFYSFSQYAGFDTSIFKPLLSNAFISKYLGYFVIVQQLTFVPLVIWKKTRFLAIGLSIIIHLTMMVQFELWKFELIVILLYGFLLTDEEWKKILPAGMLNKFFLTK